MNELTLLSFYVISTGKIIRLISNRTEANFKVVIQEDNVNKILAYDSYKDAEAATYRTLAREFSELFIERDPDLPRSMEL